MAFVMPQTPTDSKPMSSGDMGKSSMKSSRRLGSVFSRQPKGPSSEVLEATAAARVELGRIVELIEQDRVHSLQSQIRCASEGSVELYEQGNGAAGGSGGLLDRKAGYAVKRHDCGHIDWKQTLLSWRREKFTSTTIHITADTTEPIFSRDALIMVSPMSTVVTGTDIMDEPAWQIRESPSHD